LGDGRLCVGEDQLHLAYDAAPVVVGTESSDVSQVPQQGVHDPRLSLAETPDLPAGKVDEVTEVPAGYDDAEAPCAIDQVFVTERADRQRRQDHREHLVLHAGELGEHAIASRIDEASVMLLYLAGLKAVDPSLREAARMDGASDSQTFFKVVFPVMRPINIIIFVITFIESLRAFDIVWVVNKGRNGLELISTLVTTNIVGEASRIGFGSALATIMLAISSVFVVLYLRIAMREESR